MVCRKCFPPLVLVYDEKLKQHSSFVYNEDEPEKRLQRDYGPT